MASITLQHSIVYGPIFSRRLGRSFGINLLSKEEKTCSFDCIYCEYGKTLTPSFNPSANGLPLKDEVLKAVEITLEKPRTIQTLTFSGNGEPTLHPDFSEIVQGIRSVIKKLHPQVRMALLTNGSTLNRQDIRSACQLIDYVMVKLDAGDEETFKKINRPVGDFLFSELIKGLQQTPGLVLQSCLIDGAVNNINGNAYSAWVKMLAALNPEEVHIYSIDRPTNERSVGKVKPEKLEKIQKELQARFRFEIKAYCR